MKGAVAVMVKPLDKIPLTAKKTSQRERLAQDIKQAIDEGMRYFEITGECYTNKYLAMYAREVAKEITENVITDEVKRQISWRYRWRFYKHEYTQYIKIFSQKQSDGTFRVFGEIDNDELDKAITEALAEAKKEREEAEERARARGARA